MNSEETHISYYINQLPDEVKVKVFSYMDTPSIISFCEVFPAFEYLSHDKDVIQ